MRLRWAGWAMLLVFLPSSPVWAQRLPVLPQIDLPHPYYYREMYLPQLTSGPSSVAWARAPISARPDSRLTGATTTTPTPLAFKAQADSLIFSMQGCLWRLRLGQDVAEQLTDGPGYDYQPDVSSDGRWVVYSRYDKDAIELWLLDLSTGKLASLTSNGAVNVEARWSPAFNSGDTRIIFVSTQFNRHFHIFVARFDAAKQQLGSLQRITGETRSSLPRYYYSQYDHELSPTWSPDGKEIVFISNRGHIHGSGGIWRMALPATVTATPPAPRPMARGPFAMMQRAPAEVFGADAHEIHYEEATWKARPDWSPDGKRVLYSSYLGGQWQQLWVMPANGGDAFPLSYGDYDNTMPRWSPDGRRIAFISNRGGGTSLWIQDWLGGKQTQVVPRQLRWLHPHQRLTLTVVDEVGHPAAARISITGGGGRAHAPQSSLSTIWMHADDSFVRSERRYEEHYFHSTGSARGTSLQVPAGHYQIEVTRGLEYRPERVQVDVAAGKAATVTVRLKPLPPFPAAETKTRWLSGDVHVHMNYAGTYRATPQSLIAQMQGENLNIVHALIVNKEQRFPDIEYAGRLGKIDSASSAGTILTYGQEFHTSYWGHLGLLGTKNLLIPGYASYPNTAAASIFPSNAIVADLAHAQSPTALAGYVHPFDDFPAPERDTSLTAELPVDVALRKVDYYEVLGFSDHKSSAAVWYKLLNLGFRIPAAAGTDAMTNFASLRGPVGLNRVYVQMPADPARTPSETLNLWMAGLKHGQTFATNGPLLRFSLGGETAGGEVKIPNSQTVKFRASMRSIVPVDHLEIVCNGAVAMSIPLNPSRDTVDASGGLVLSRSGWCVLRAWAEKSEYPVLDIYPYATTSPIYVQVAGQPARSPEDAKYFMAWIDRLIANAQTHPGYNSDAEKQQVLDELRAAREIYARITSEPK